VAHHTDGMLLLVPADPLRPRRPDEHFAAEAAAAKDAGVDVALIDHDALADPGGAERAVARVPNAGGTAIYRGWMLRADQYTALAAALQARDVTLRTSAAQYRRAHELPGWPPRCPRSPRRQNGPTATATANETSTWHARASAKARRSCATTSSQ
jgi:hypothetical protein